VLLSFSVAAGAAACSFAVEAIAVTRSSLRRPPVALLLHLAALAVMAAGCIALTGRPIFSVAAALVLPGLLAVIGNAKYASLREPLVFSDLILFSQVFSHPRLYLPFLGVGQLAIVLAGIAVVVAAFVAESLVAFGPRCAAAVVALISLPVCVALAPRLPLTLHPFSDQRRFGFFVAFTAYLINGLSRAERRTRSRTSSSSRANPISTPAGWANACLAGPTRISIVRSVSRSSKAN
jgi:hypothetical protein